MKIIRNKKGSTSVITIIIIPVVIIIALVFGVNYLNNTNSKRKMQSFIDNEAIYLLKNFGHKVYVADEIFYDVDTSTETTDEMKNIINTDLKVLDGFTLSNCSPDADNSVIFTGNKQIMYECLDVEIREADDEKINIDGVNINNKYIIITLYYATPKTKTRTKSLDSMTTNEKNAYKKNIKSHQQDMYNASEHKILLSNLSTTSVGSNETDEWFSYHIVQTIMSCN